jgi:hypothetical protein
MTGRPANLTVVENKGTGLNLSGLKAQKHKTVEKRKAAAQTKETTLQLLLRLFGDSIRGIFPKEIGEAVEAAFEHYKTHPDSFLVTEWGSEQEKIDTLAILRAWCEIAPGDRLSVHVDWDSEPEVLHWRVQPFKARGRAAQKDEEITETSEVSGTTLDGAGSGE